MYRPVGARQKDVSTRLMKPTSPLIRVKDVLRFVNNWEPSCEFDGLVSVFDAGIAQYFLVDDRSHDIFYASLILGKPSLRCKLAGDEPKDILDEEANNTLCLIDDEDEDLTDDDHEKINFLKTVLARRGFRFVV